MDGHRLLRAEFLAAEAADALAIVHHGPFVYHGYGLRRAVAQTGAAAVAIAVHDRPGASHFAVKAEQELGDSVGSQPEQDAQTNDLYGLYRLCRLCRLCRNSGAIVAQQWCNSGK